jgi:hypothetical protein
MKITTIKSIMHNARTNQYIHPDHIIELCQYTLRLHSVVVAVHEMMVRLAPGNKITNQIFEVLQGGKKNVDDRDRR